MAASGQFQGVLADHQHQEDQGDPEDPSLQYLQGRLVGQKHLGVRGDLLALQAQVDPPLTSQAQ